MAISQKEFEYLIRIEKGFENLSESLKLGPAPIRWSRQLISVENKESFILDFYRGSFELSRYTYNKRYRQTIILLRYDNGGRHTNPDGVLFEGPHVHLYKEGYNDKFAYPIEEINVNSEDSIEKVLQKILHFCNVTQIPSIEVPMF